ncbi:glycosyltransferase family 4 protein [Azospirillum sp.]|uniref:glycosyltransferase family 4 protein n=1 Tax=Azospirillum sp. TaxID=34012 RepID=UPI002D4AABA9|nr:glycosyltransferase family 4 protein [Azospirillum sp.]HYD71328.1 glycosyltransferase family 4 protein [Azospirillum sp.]
MTGRRVICVASFMNHAGAQEALVRLARLLRARGWEAEVWFLYEESAAYHDEPNVRVLLPVTHPGKLGYLRIAASLVRELRRARPDAVVSFLPLANIMAQAAACALRVPVRVASQRIHYHAYSRGMRLLDRAAGTLGVYTSIVCVSRFVLGTFAGHPEPYRRRLDVVHNGIQWQPSALSKAQARARFGLPPDRPLVLAVGRMKTQKNYPFLLRVMARLPGARLLIAGDGPLRAALEVQAADLGITDAVTFLGNVQRRDVPDLLRAVDVFAQPSLFEGQSNSLLEAMHEGLAIIASDIPAQAETLRGPEGEAAGVLIPLDDEQAWATALRALLTDGARRAQLGRLAQERVEAFTPERMADGFERALRPAGGTPTGWVRA